MWEVKRSLKDIISLGGVREHMANNELNYLLGWGSERDLVQYICVKYICMCGHLDGQVHVYVSVSACVSRHRHKDLCERETDMSGLVYTCVCKCLFPPYWGLASHSATLLYQFTLTMLIHQYVLTAAPPMCVFLLAAVKSYDTHTWGAN